MRRRSGRKRHTAKLTLVALAALFALPLVIAWVLYSGAVDYSPQQTVNRGTLLEPSVRAAVPAEFRRRDIAEHWVLLYSLPRDCGDPCICKLVDLRQVHRALGKNSARLRVVLIASTAADDDLSKYVESIYPEFHLVVDHAGKLLMQLERINAGRGTYIIDPLGNIMMHYVPEAAPDDMKADLQRLIQYATTDTRE